MNTYKITFTRENGTQGADHFTAPTEQRARKDFNDCYRHGTGTIISVELIRTDAPATKQQEREALDKIRKVEFLQSCCQRNLNGFQGFGRTGMVVLVILHSDMVGVAHVVIVLPAIPLFQYIRQRCGRFQKGFCLPRRKVVVFQR